ncbi:MAG: hypothetical protein ACI35R_09840 [Bacillus sp. (in: firmicutes)]
MTGVKRISILAVCSLLLSACNPSILSNNCPPNVVIEWANVVMINDIQYEHAFPEPADENTSPSIEKGHKIGEVTYQMADHACSNHQMKNGDAAFLEEGTPLYEIKGYPPSLMVAANNQVYTATDNKKAKTVGELYPVAGLVKDIHIESSEDGRRLHTFPPSSKDRFLQSWRSLKLEDIETFYRKDASKGEQIFLEIELNNGISFRQVYWTDSNTFNNGATGDAEIEKIIKEEIAVIP